jgi:hypothetical protein
MWQHCKKIYPVIGHGGPQDCVMSRLPYFLDNDNQLTDGVEVVWSVFYHCYKRISSPYWRSVTSQPLRRNKSAVCMFWPSWPTFVSIPMAEIAHCKGNTNLKVNHTKMTDLRFVGPYMNGHFWALFGIDGMIFTIWNISSNHYWKHNYFIWKYEHIKKKPLLKWNIKSTN